MESVVLWVVVGFLALVVAVLYQLVRQHGRLLLRLDDLERRLSVDEAQDEEYVTQGLAVGTEFSPFRFPDLTGTEVSLDEFRGKRLVLVNWSPGCGFCDLIAGDLAEVEPELRKRNAALLLVAYGEADENRRLAEEHGLECPILLGQPQEFGFQGTPVAYLLDEDGRVARPLATGADEVLTLARDAAKQRKRLAAERSLAESRLEREGLKPGTPAPGFALPDVSGRTVSLEEFRGRRVLLVFSDPNCGPCDALGPDLVELHREHRDNNLEIVMVGRGELEENRRKAEEHGFEFPVVVQDRWKLSKEYGIFATPVAFLIDEKGVIADTVAQGRDEIRRLAETGLVAGREE